MQNMQRNAGGKYKPWFYSSLIYEPHKTHYLIISMNTVIKNLVFVSHAYRSNCSFVQS